MRNWTIIVVLAVAGFFLTGCSVTVGGGGGHGGWERGNQNDAVTLKEIDAAAEMMMENSREESLKNIAARPNLSADAQVRLVHVALNELMMENSRKSVILTLIDNPYFISDGKMAILENMGGLMMESSRRDVMEALNRRGHVPSGREIEVIVEPAGSDDQAVQMKTTIEMTYSTGL